MKISILCNDLSNKALGRAFVIGKALEKKYEVKIIGPIYGDDIWYPFRHSFNYVTFKGYYNPFFPLQLKNYLKNIDGELIFAIKPHINSFGVALFLKMTRKIPLILDIDDWEFGFALSQGFWNMIKIFPQELIRPEGYPYNLFLDKFIKYADAITTVSTFLQKRYGGIIIPHARDERLFDPVNYNNEKIKIKFGFSEKKIILFLGSPSRHKGILNIIQALKKINDEKIIFLIAGDTNNPFIKQIYKENQKFVKLMGYQPINKVPELLSMADLVVLPSISGYESIGQIPAKIFDAMAMEKPIIASNTSDLPIILNGCGIIVSNENIDDLSKNIEIVLNNPYFALELGKKARKKFLDEYSLNVIEEKLLYLVERVMDKNRNENL